VEAKKANWQRWGTYLPERQWGTLREDYCAEKNPWSFTHDMARFRAYRWGEDGLLGWTDRQCRLCFSTSLWNGCDPILKERLFGLSNPEGNHGEDVKELYYYLDATPTHSYAKALYKYPQVAFPYADLVATNAARGLGQREYELLDTGIFDNSRYFDVTIEYAKADIEDTLIRITVANRGPDEASLIVLPTLTLRNNWSWRTLEPGTETRPWMALHGQETVVANHSLLGRYRFEAVGGGEAPEVIFTENDTNVRRLDPHFQGDQGFSKDGFDSYLLHSETGAVNPEQRGTKAAFVRRLSAAAGASATLCFRLAREDAGEPAALDQQGFDAIFATRIREADAFYAEVIGGSLSEDERSVSRQAYAGLLWSKQFYYYVAERWRDGDPAQPRPPESRATSASDDWRHLFCRDILSVPDKWEYPWFAAWDLAFQMVPMAKLDPTFAKNQLILLLREWYLHPNGQMPAYENSFSDVNPPVHAFAVYQVYAIAAEQTGHKDTDFLERAFQKLLLNFTWWVNRNDADGRNLFGGGFLGLDNISVFDRDMTLPDGATLSQADATAWMGLFCASMLRIATELAQTRPIYQDIAIKFFGHYIAIIDAINTFGGTGLWDEERGFYFDQVAHPDKGSKLLAVHSIVGIVPLFGIVSLRKSELDAMPEFHKRLRWFLKHRPHLAAYVTPAETDDPALAGSHFLSLVPKDRLKRVLAQLFDEDEFLSPHGVRALSKVHDANPYVIELDGRSMTVRYVSGESDSNLFGGNSNWRGPVWFPINGLLINAFQRYYAVYGDAFTFDVPTRSGRTMTLRQASVEIARRCGSIFLRDGVGRRPCHGEEDRYRDDPHWRDLTLFNEYFDGDSGRGLGASHQTGWTALVATILDTLHRPYSGMF
jgi:hypothetical protein